MRVLPPPKAPPSRRGALGRWHHALLGHQRRQHGRSLRERSPVLCVKFGQAFRGRHRDGERQPDSSLDGKFSLESNFAIGARISAEFSKPKILRPDRRFESHLVRQLVCCFYRENRRAKIISKSPRVSSGQLATGDRREQSLVSTRAL
jgi:hypothetical protein